MDTLMGIAPAPETSDAVHSRPPPPASSPDASPDSAASKFEAAAQLLEQKRASLAPKPPTEEEEPETNLEASQASVADASAEDDELSRTPPAAEVAPESVGPSRRDRGDAPPSSRRRSSAPPPRSSALPFAIAAAVFVVMFLVGAMRAMRDEFRDAKSTTSQTSVVERPQPTQPAITPASAPALPAVVAEPEPSAAAPTPPVASGAEPAPSASAAQEGQTKVLVRAAIEGAKFFRRGKQIGMNSIIVELAPGEKRAYEVNLPGYVSRKVVIDGSSAEVVVSMAKKRSAAASASETAPAPADEPSAQ